MNAPVLAVAAIAAWLYYTQKAADKPVAEEKPWDALYGAGGGGGGGRCA